MQGKRGNTSAAGEVVGLKKPRGGDGKDDLSLRFLVNSKHAGGIIGKGGSTIKRFREEYQATVTLPDSNSSERVLTISTDKEDVLKILDECLQFMKDPPYPQTRRSSSENSDDKAGENEVNLLVQASQVGSIIGSGGANIKRMREETTASMKLFQDCLPNSTERVLAIAGDNAVVLNCVRKAVETIEAAPIKGSVQHYDPSCAHTFNDFGYHGGRDDSYGRGGGDFGYPMGGGGYSSARPGYNHQHGYDRGFTDFRGPGGGGMGGRQQQETRMKQEFGDNMGAPPAKLLEGANEERQTTQVTIPENLGGAIIGKGGERIRHIRHSSGAEVRIEDCKAGESDRLITISGNPKQIEHAQYLMQQSVQNYQK